MPDMNSMPAWPSGYSTVMASDLSRNGMALELWNISDSQEELIAEAFYDDRCHELSVTAFDESVPRKLIEKLHSEAKVRLLPGDVSTGAQ